MLLFNLFAFSVLLGEFMVEGCNQVLTGNQGTFQSPNYPNDYPNDARCDWSITADPGTQITVTFNSFDIENAFACNYDVVFIRDGDSDTSNLLSRLCGLRSSINPIQTSGNAVYIKFLSDGSVTRSGFQAQWSASAVSSTTSRPSGCGQALLSNAGTVQSPNYPNPYPNNAQCVWTIETDPGTQVTLSFSAFNLEENSNCAYDSLEVRDGSNQNSALLGKFCGADRPGPITASGNLMFLEFSSDGSVTRTGFRAQWSLGCNNVFTNSQGTVQSPNYPNNYGNNAQCVWTIETDAGTQVTLSFSDFNLEDSTNCVYDSLVVYDGNSQSADLIGTFCGQVRPDRITASGNVMFIEFRSDSTVTRSGFQAQYSSIPSSSVPAVPSSTVPAVPSSTVPAVPSSTVPAVPSPTVPSVPSSTVPAVPSPTVPSVPSSTVPAGCNVTLTDNQGTIQSPNYPNNYENNAQCVWTIETDPGTQVTLSFSVFSLEGSTNCVYDSLVIRDGNSQRSGLIGTFCGEATPGPITASGNIMYIEFKSDGSVTSSGFEAVYSSVPSSTVPAVPSSTVPAVPSSTVPAEPSSVGPEVCGRTMSGNGGFFQSPNFPGNYPDNTQCVWTITTDPGFQVHLTFSVFSLEEANGCIYDYVLIRDGNNQSAEILAEKCGFSIPCPITSTGNEMFIEFKSDGSVTSSGFQATWSAVNIITELNDTNCQDNSTATYPTPSTVDNSTATYTTPSTVDNGTATYTTPSSVACGQAMSGTSGSIQSPNYPFNYPNNAMCVWNITTDPGFQVQLTFSAFSLEAVGCVYDVVIIYDGNSPADDILLKICGTSNPGPILSTENEMLIVFRSDDIITYSGFSAMWTAVDRTQLDNSTTQECGQVMSGTAGSFQSPNYPFKYPPNAQCVWSITTDPGAQIDLTFTAFALEAGDCSYDYVIIYDGTNQTDDVLVETCGTSIPLTITSTGSEMLIEFRSDGSGEYSGFSAVWTAVHGNSGPHNFTTPVNGTSGPGNFTTPVPDWTEDCQQVIRQCTRLFWIASSQYLGYTESAINFLFCIKNGCPVAPPHPAITSG